MKLIGVTGPISSGKTTLLARIAREAAERMTVDGILSLAGERPESGTGAAEYDIQFIAARNRVPFLKRAPEGNYMIVVATVGEISDWAGSLVGPDLLIFDELGKWEAQGTGLLGQFIAATMSRPRFVVASLREDVQEAIEGHIEIQFDLVVNADDPQAASKILEAIAQSSTA